MDPPTMQMDLPEQANVVLGLNRPVLCNTEKNDWRHIIMSEASLLSNAT